MALSPEEILELLNYLRARVRSAGLDTFDDAIVADLREADASPAQLLLEYLGGLDSDFAARSLSTVRQTMDRLNEFVVVEDGQRVESVRLELTGGDARFAGSDGIELTEALPDLRAQRAALRDLASYLLSEMERPDVS